MTQINAWSINNQFYLYLDIGICICFCAIISPIILDLVYKSSLPWRFWLKIKIWLKCTIKSLLQLKVINISDMIYHWWHIWYTCHQILNYFHLIFINLSLENALCAHLTKICILEVYLLKHYFESHLIYKWR